MNIYLDDERRAPRGWVQANTAADCVRLLELLDVANLSLDHDLGGDTNYGTGYDVLLWIEQRLMEGNLRTALPNITIHTANPVGRSKMELALLSIHRFNEQTKQGIICQE